MLFKFLKKHEEASGKEKRAKRTGNELKSQGVGSASFGLFSKAKEIEQ
jgi:hypothetical protein